MAVSEEKQRHECFSLHWAKPHFIVPQPPCCAVRQQEPPSLSWVQSPCRSYRKAGIGCHTAWIRLVLVTNINSSRKILFFLRQNACAERSDPTRTEQVLSKAASVVTVYIGTA